MIRSDQIDKLATALAKAQGAIEDADKDTTNPHFKSRYSDLASVRAAIRKPLSDNGLSYVQLPRTAEKAVEVETLLMHESGQFIGETLSMPVQAMTAQAIGSALTYAKRYGLMAVVGVASSDDDDDGNAATARPRAQLAAQTPAARDDTPFDDASSARKPIEQVDQIAVAGWKKEIAACASNGDLDALKRSAEFKTDWKAWGEPTRDAVQRMFDTAAAAFVARANA